MNKRKILILSDYEGAFTGFGRWKFALMKELYSYNKYELVSAAMGMVDGSPDFLRFPWRIRGVIPNNPQEVAMLQQDPNKMRMASYGDFFIDQIVKEEKPDIILGAQDSWGILHLVDKPFFKHIPTIVSVTFDSKPFLKDQIEKAKDIKYYWSWNNFAVEEFKRLGINNVEVSYPGMNLSYLNRMNLNERKQLKQKFGLNPDSFGILFIFRSQLRKLIDKLIHGYAVFKQRNPAIKNTYLHLHTSHREGWNIMGLIEQYGVPKSEVYFTYICRVTKQFFVLPYQGEEIDNPATGDKKSMVTVGVGEGITDEEMNEIYNLNDFYIHPATSGATELPLVLAAASGMIVSCCDYSFGEDVIKFNKAAIELDFQFYTEWNTNFLKSNPYEESIAKAIRKVYEMKEEKRLEQGKISQQWARANYDVIKNTKKIAEFIDNLPQHNWDFTYKERAKNPDAQITNHTNDIAWLKEMYAKILNMEISDNDKGLSDWVASLANGMKREDIHKFFQKTAIDKNKELGVGQSQQDFSALFDQNGKKKLLFVLPKSSGDILWAMGLLEDASKTYPPSEWDIYFACEKPYQEILESNPYIHKVIDYNPQMDSLFFLEGIGNHKGFVDLAFLLHWQTQRAILYAHKNDKINYNTNLLSLKSFSLSDEEVQFHNKFATECINPIPWTTFHVTGTVLPLNEAIEYAKKNGPDSLGTIGYFYDENNKLTEASKIKDYL